VKENKPSDQTMNCIWKCKLPIP